MIEARRTTLLAVLGVFVLAGGAHAAPRLIACMTAHKEEMKALNAQIAALEKTKVKPGGPKAKHGQCEQRLQTIGGSTLLHAADKNTADHREKIACLAIKKTLIEQQCICDAKGLEFSSDPAVIDKTLAAQKLFADAQKAARRGSLRSPPEVRKIADDMSKLRGCYSEQAVGILNKGIAAVEKIAHAAR